MPGKQILNFGDQRNDVAMAIWWKAIFLLPIWAFLLVPILGFLLEPMGQIALNIGYCLVIIGGLIYFVNDYLKQRIAIDARALHFGLRRFPISQLTSVGLSFKSEALLPLHLVFNFSTGDVFKFKLTRLNPRELESLLKLLETSVPSCKVDALAKLLCKCQKMANKNMWQTDSKVLFTYNSHHVIRELIESFMHTLGQWATVGPLILLGLAAPIWLSVINYTYLCTADRMAKGNLAVYKSGMELSQQCYTNAFTTMSHVGAPLNDLFTHHPFALVGFMVALPMVIIYFLRLLMKPNLLIVDTTGLQFQFRYAGHSLYKRTFPWSTFSSAHLWNRNGLKGSGKWKIKFRSHSGEQDTFIDLAAIVAHDRTRLIHALQRFAVRLTIQSDLQEAMFLSQSKSYTELWLQSLTEPPERKRLEPLSPGQTLLDNRYEVIHRLGIGGQGSAYLCKQHDPGNTGCTPLVVLKETILPLYTNSALRRQAFARFEKEAQILEQLDSDKIVKLLDSFIEDHRGYLVLEHIDGRNLKQLVLEDGPIAEETAIDFALQMCQILSYLHSHDVIHRDFTPDNLILGQDGKIKLIDFNVAQNIEAGTTGAVVGKHAYLPPEQIRGKETPQSDIYTMGATMFFLLAGIEPEPISVQDLTKLGCPVSEQTAQLIRHCTELSCSKRVQGIDELRAELLGQIVSDLDATDLDRTTSDGNENGSESTTLELKEAEKKITA